jgi:hypothetical protein
MTNMATKRTNENIGKFFEARFERTPEQDPIYFDEWVYRFRTMTTPVLYKIADDECSWVWYCLTGEMI